MKRVVDIWSNAPVIDLVLSVVLGLAGACWLQLLAESSSADRSSIYSSAADVIAVIGGLGSIAVSTYVGLSGRRIRALQETHSKPLNRNLASFIFATAGATLLCWVAQIAEARHNIWIAWFFVLVGVTWCCLTVSRQAWLFLNLVAISALDVNDDSKPEVKTPEFNGLGKDGFSQKAEEVRRGQPTDATE